MRKKVPMVYALRDPRDGAIRYVGASKKGWGRLTAHLYAATRRSYPVYEWVKGLLSVGLTPEFVELEKCAVEELGAREVAHIAMHREAGSDLLNVCSGGKGSPGHALSGDALERVRTCNIGRKHSEEFCRKISERLAKYHPMAGKQHTEESREKMRRSHLGRKLSDAHRAAQSAGMRGRPKGPMSDRHKKILRAAAARNRGIRLKDCMNNEFNTLQDAARFHKLKPDTIRRSLQGHVLRCGLSFTFISKGEN